MDFIDDLDVSIIANILVNMGIDISNLNDITDADDYEDTISTITASLEKLRNEEDPLYVLLELIAGDNEELVDFYLKWLDFTKEPRICTMIGKPINFRPSTPKVHIISTQRFQ